MDLLVDTDFVDAFGDILIASEILDNILQGGTLLAGTSCEK